VPNLQKQLVSQCIEELLRYGAVGEKGIGCRGFLEKECGPSEDEVSAVPVLRLPFAEDVNGEAALADADSVPVYSTALLFGGGAGTTQSKIFLSLTKMKYSEEFTLGLQDSNGGSMHIVHIADRHGEEPLGLHSGVCEVGSLNLVIITLLDVAPRALRIAIVEPASRVIRQLVVLDSRAGKDVLPFPDMERKRAEILDTYKDGFTTTPMMAGVTKGAQATPRSRPTTGSSGQPLPSKLLRRVTQKLPSGQPVVLSVVREIISDGSVRFRVNMYNPVSAKEMSISLRNPLLDRVLASCGLGSSSSGIAEEVDRRGVDVAVSILRIVSVHPDGTEMDFRGATADESQDA
jgi:hypothetical protein